ncbi:2-dehydro-3-deoxy-phosphogluconate aldolase [Evansella caseinilytica]|uniref:2-dehydro-3-deoxy-phosphogluconate aldolase n=1 Tax=Evansella caseinilytica TaxID=1503961 RepID=A0A1H3HK99_9BACI|nr:KDGP aldolase [Evansella caseinilytica]SDY15204.1 2-dehydro-3-deoxy-phosphogluconate aldolase [Evansella caseinilytica]
MNLQHKVIYNVLAKGLDNALELVETAGEQILIGVMVKDFPTEAAAVQQVRSFKENGVPVSVGLGAADPAMWRKVADVAVKTKPDHINQIFPAAGYTLGRMELLGERPVINAVIEPSGISGEVIISTGPVSSGYREKVSCEMAASMLAEIGVQSVKFYPIAGDKKLDEVAAMVKAASAAGLKIFEPTGGIGVDNIAPVLQTCLDNGAETVIPHLYTSLINKQTGKTEIAKIQRLLDISKEIISN